MHSLQALCIFNADGTIVLSADARELPALHTLVLHASSIVAEAGARLPALLTELRISDEHCAAMPPQVGVGTIKLVGPDGCAQCA